MQSTRLMRARINDRLARATKYPVALIVAPAGFGKSVALRDFLLTSRLDVVRFDVRREDDTLLAFAGRFSDALSAIVPATAASFPAMQQQVLAAPDPARQICTWFAEHLLKTVCTIVIDDLHFAAADPRAVAFLAELIERTCDRINWIVATRSDAGLPVASWLAYGRMDLPIDENELRFTVEEALAAADEAQNGVEPAEVESLLELTQGWPVALAIALRTRTHAADLRSAAASSRDLVYRYLAEQVFAGVDDAQREFLRATAIFSTFDAAIAQSLGGTAEFIGELRRGVAFLTETAPGQYRYHDLFRDFLENELQRRGETKWRAALNHGGRLLQERNDTAGALALYAKAGNTAAVVHLLERSGFALFERGHADVLAAAIAALPERGRAENASAVGLQAMLHAARGHFDLAKRGFTVAIDCARDDDLRFALVHRYAIELVRHDLDCIGLLEPYANDETVAAHLRVPLLGTLATAYARSNRAEEALATMTTALDHLGPSSEDDVRARLYQQAAFVFLLEASHVRARDYAGLAVELAMACNLYEVAVRAYSVLFQITYDDTDDPIACLSILDRLLDSARKGASNQARLFGLMASCWIEAERGNDAALEQIDAALDANSSGLPRAKNEALLPALALRAGWNKEFENAYGLLHGTLDRAGSDDRRAYRASELAVYAFAAGLHREGEAALEQAVSLLNHATKQTRRLLCARLIVAIAELVRGHTAAAHRHLSEVERVLPPVMRRLRALAHVVRTLYRVALGQAERPALTGALERLRAEHFGGMARLLESIAFPEGAEGSYALLTVAEREILHLLATGASTKEMAAQTGRSPRTIDTHVRSICHKLNCRSRRAAIALATGAGWVHAQ